MNGSNKNSPLTQCEQIAAVAMTVCALVMHYRVLSHAGPLWRDEINGLNVALMPTWKEIWRSIIYYPFPLLHDLLLRVWIAIGFGKSDFQLRIFSFLTAIWVLVAIWLSCGIVDRRRAPLWPLALVALSPVAIQEGDWLRPYALAMSMVILVFAFVWRLTLDGTVRAFALASCAAVLSVQVIFSNAILVFAICFAGITLLACQRRWRNAARVLTVGVVAALSLIPYAPMLQRAREGSVVFKAEHALSHIAAEGIGALANRNVFVTVIWFLVPIVALTMIFLVPEDSPGDMPKTASDRILFGFLVLLVAAAGTVAFVQISGGLMARYFMPFAALASMCIFAVTGAFERSKFVRLLGFVAALAVACVFVPPAQEVSATRATNCDLIAAKLTTDASDSDFILLTSFTYGISFSRYYSGPAKWRTLPDLSDRSQHRWDLALEEMQRADPLAETLLEVERTLRDHHKVFVIGALPSSNAGSAAESGPPWTEETLRSRVAQFLHRHVTSSARLPVIDDKQPVNSYEDLPLFVAEGWHPSDESDAALNGP